MPQRYAFLAKLQNPSPTALRAKVGSVDIFGRWKEGNWGHGSGRIFTEPSPVEIVDNFDIVKYGKTKEGFGFWFGKNKIEKEQDAANENYCLWVLCIQEPTGFLYTREVRTCVCTCILLSG